MEISGDLTWKEHTEKLKTKLRQRLGVLRRLKYCLPKSALKQVAEALFMSKLRYGIAVYCKPKLNEQDSTNKMLKELTVLQNEMMRIITGKKCKDKVSIKYLRDTTKTTSVNHVACYHILMETYGVIHEGTSADLKKLLTHSINTHSMNTRSATQLKVSEPDNKGRKNDFVYYGAKLWNLIPESLRAGPAATHESSKISSSRSMTQKEQKIAAQKLAATKKAAFRKGIKTWISSSIPSD